MKSTFVVLAKTQATARRSFLLSAGALAVASVLPGCATQPLGASAGARREEPDARVASNSRIRGMSATEIREAKQAQRVFDAMARSKSLPVDEHLTFLVDEFRQNLTGMPQVLSDVRMADVGGDLAEVVRVALARQQRQRKSKPAAIVKQGGGILDIPAMSAATISMHGYCMDQNLPAPGAGTLLRFRPAADFASANFGDIEKAVMVYVQANPGKVGYQSIQHLIWGLRGVGTGANFTTSMASRPDLLAVLDKAKPGSASRFLSEIKREQQRKAAREQLHKLLPSLAKLEKLAALPEDLSNILSGKAAVDKHLASLNRPVEGRAQVPDLAAYSVLAPGVYMRAKGTSPLAANAMIVNLSDDDFRYDPIEWVAESQLPQQRVAFSGIRSADTLQVAPDGSFDLGAFMEDASRDIGMKVLGSYDTQGAALRVYEIGKADRRMLAKAAAYGLQIPLASMPVVGNVFSAYELISGQNAFTGETLSRAERILAAFGSIPGYGSIVKVAGGVPQAGKLLGAIANKASVPLSAIEKTGWAQDLAGIGMMNVSQDEMLWDASIRIAKELIVA